MFIKIKEIPFSLNVLVVCLVLCLTIGCDKASSKKTDTSMPNFLTRIYSQEELNKKLKVGMSRQDIINVFGIPLAKTDKTFIYRMDFNKKISKENKDAIVGFSVIFRDDKVEKWRLAYTKFQPLGDKNNKRE
jgi:outer membrane protein assembly factor BamE (lipoprotein component of BamABCDE complex)